MKGLQCRLPHQICHRWQQLDAALSTSTPLHFLPLNGRFRHVGTYVAACTSALYHLCMPSHPPKNCAIEMLPIGLDPNLLFSHPSRPLSWIVLKTCHLATMAFISTAITCILWDWQWGFTKLWAAHDIFQYGHRPWQGPRRPSFRRAGPTFVHSASPDADERMLKSGFVGSYFSCRVPNSSGTGTLLRFIST
jgi:hypothetical protein